VVDDPALWVQAISNNQGLATDN